MIGPEFDNLCRIVKERSGLHLTGSRMPMVTSRLIPLAQRLGHRNVQDFLARLQHDSSEELLVQVLDALTTFETSFFRDPAQFALLRHEILPDLMLRRARTRRIRILSAACSSGQEPYSLAILATELGLAEKGWTVEITGTDYSDSALARARQARYSQFELYRGLDEAMIARHFIRDGEDYAPKAPLRTMVKFRKHNLLEAPDDLGQFDIVLCRNVLFYFDAASKMNALATLRMMTKEDGFLLLASSETQIGESHGFMSYPQQRGVFRMPETTARSRLVRAVYA